MVKSDILKLFVLLIGLLLPTTWNGANGTNLTMAHSDIIVKEALVQGTPKGSTIQASINGHTLSVYFSENIGQVTIEITTAAGAPVQYFCTQTPDGLEMYIVATGDYIVTFTLSNGDEYYGEFTVTD